jgi:hypothetical protein
MPWQPDLLVVTMLKVLSLSKLNPPEKESPDRLKRSNRKSGDSMERVAAWRSLQG